MLYARRGIRYARALGVKIVQITEDMYPPKWMTEDDAWGQLRNNFGKSIVAVTLRVPITGIRKLADLPRQARAYLDLIESSVGVPISHVSVGPSRDQIIYV